MVVLGVLGGATAGLRSWRFARSVVLLSKRLWVRYLAKTAFHLEMT